MDKKGNGEIDKTRKIIQTDKQTETKIILYFTKTTFEVKVFL